MNTIRSLFLASGFLINIVLSVIGSGIAGYEPIEVYLDFTVNGKTRVILSSDDSEIMAFQDDETSVFEEVSDSFELIYDEPGNYEYVISDNITQYDVQIAVFSNKDNTLSYMMTAKDEKETKVESLNFYRPIDLQVVTKKIGEGSTSGDGIYHIGDTANLVAIPADGWYFIGWQTEESSTITGLTDCDVTFKLPKKVPVKAESLKHEREEIVTEDKTIYTYVAVFEKKEKEPTVTPTPSGDITPTPVPTVTSTPTPSPVPGNPKVPATGEGSDIQFVVIGSILGIISIIGLAVIVRTRVSGKEKKESTSNGEKQ